MSATNTYRNALPDGSKLSEYLLQSVLGAGGFGITYLCRDTHLDKLVAIKEYFPTDLAVRALDGGVIAINSESETQYQWGLQRFIQEARTLAKFSHPHIVRVNRYFEANATGYMVMDYEDGQSLNQLLKTGAPFDESRMLQVLEPLLSGLQAVHNAGFLHRDIKPSNIFIRSDGSPVLLDFGSARQTMTGATKTLTSMLTPGFAPLEQYTGDGKQGPWTDIYALGSVLFRALSGESPPDAVSRLKNDNVAEKLARLEGKVSTALLRAVEWAMALDEKKRPQRIEDWREALEGKKASATQAQFAARETSATVARGPNPAPPKSPVRPSLTPPEVNRARWRWLAIAALMLAVLGTVNVWYQAREQARAASAAQEAARAASELQRREAQRLGEQRASEQREMSLREERQRRAEREAAMRRDSITAPPPAAAVLPVPETESVPVAPRPEPPAPPAPVQDARRTPLDEPLNSDDPMARRKQLDMRAMDSDGDGYLSRDEVRGMPLVPQEFDRIDTDGDGRMSLGEFLNFRPTLPPPPGRDRQ